jgi:hypothetical protein
VKLGLHVFYNDRKHTEELRRCDTKAARLKAAESQYGRDKRNKCLFYTELNVLGVL